MRKVFRLNVASIFLFLVYLVMIMIKYKYFLELNYKLMKR